jgi:hypothetical protein
MRSSRVFIWARATSKPASQKLPPIVVLVVLDVEVGGNRVVLVDVVDDVDVVGAIVVLVDVVDDVLVDVDVVGSIVVLVDVEVVGSSVVLLDVDEVGSRVVLLDVDEVGSSVELVDDVEVVPSPANVRWCSARRDPEPVANRMQAVTLQSTVPPAWLKKNVVATVTVVVKLPELSVVNVPTRGCRQKPRAHWNIWPSSLGWKPVPTTVTA